LKHVARIILILCLLLPHGAYASAQPQGIQVTIDGKAQHYQQAPLNLNGSIVVPLRAIFEALEAELTYESTTKIITATTKTTTIIIQVGSTIATINDKKVVLAQAPVIINNFTYVPVRFVSESFGGDVQWDHSHNTVQIIREGTDPKVIAQEAYKATLEGKNVNELNDLLINEVNKQQPSLIYIESLLQLGADPNIRSTASFPLEIAVINRNLELTELLLKYDADPNQTIANSKYEYTNTKSILNYLADLRYSFAEGRGIDEDMDVAVLELLLAYKADPNLIGDTKNSKAPIINSAIIYNRIKIVQALLAGGASPNVHPEDPLQNAPLHHAIHFSTLSFVKTHNLDPSLYPSQHPEIVKLLLEYGADPNGKTLGTTPLDQAKSTYTTTWNKEQEITLPNPIIIRLIEEYLNKP
jgi:ankyrin repeat protein